MISAKRATPWLINVRRFGFFFIEALRSIKANVAVAIAATTTVAIAVFVLGAFIPSFLFVQSTVDAQKDKIEVRAYLAPQATPDQVNELRDAIEVMTTADADPRDGGRSEEGGASSETSAERDGSDLVAGYWFVSTDDALESFRETLQDPSIIDDLPNNPLPASFDIEPVDAAQSQAIVDRIISLPAIDTELGVTNGGDVTDRLLQVARFIQWAGLALIIILVIASLLLIANTIRLSVFARRRRGRDHASGGRH